jgi:hypothetical protein
MSTAQPSPAQPDDARLNELLQQFREAEDYDTPPGLAGDRDSHGRFAKGNLGGPGNPCNRRVAQLRRIMLEEVSDDAMRVMIQVLLFKAQTGDLAAIKLVLQYVLGKPTPAPDPDAVERSELQPEPQETPPPVDPQPKRRTSERLRREQASVSAAPTTNSPCDTVTDANGLNGPSAAATAGNTGTTPLPSTGRIPDDMSRQLRD